MTFGINDESCLQKLPSFDVTECLPFDIMHTIFEGVAVYHLRHLLIYLIDRCSYFSLDDLNHILESFHYGYTETDTKPSPIRRDSSDHSTFHIKCSGKYYY